MGFPYEGPAPLEALAEGCVFFNAKLNPPHSALNTQFFEPKPTYRKVRTKKAAGNAACTENVYIQSGLKQLKHFLFALFQLASQLPYLESIGPPNVQTLYIHDIEEVKKAVDEALKAIESGQVCGSLLCRKSSLWIRVKSGTFEMGVSTWKHSNRWAHHICETCSPNHVFSDFSFVVGCFLFIGKLATWGPQMLAWLGIAQVFCVIKNFRKNCFGQICRLQIPVDSHTFV